MNPDQTPTLHLNLDGNAEENRNWALIDAAATQLFSAMGLGQPLSYLLAGALAGAPTGGLSIGIWIATLAFTLPTDLVGSQAHAKTAATASAAFPLTVNGTQKGTITWAAGQTIPSFTLASVSVAPGDIIELLAPATPDASLADLVWTIKGNI